MSERYFAEKQSNDSTQRGNELPVIISKNDARQGHIDHHVLYVRIRRRRGYLREHDGFPLLLVIPRIRLKPDELSSRRHTCRFSADSQPKVT
jgi:hypothetical protein